MTVWLSPEDAARLGESKPQKPNVGQMQLLLSIVEGEIAREDEYASTLVRAGLLRDLLVFALAVIDDAPRITHEWAERATKHDSGADDAPKGAA